ncbi:ABC transporter ATP-binding protein/permease [Haloplasma contractile]|uniref:Macrolide transport system ATP-binding-permease protein n=1 Tax=Haloplasma contractile SSD-17B TaxID=1033810 RepID=F7PVY5_9MOLU|nr:ABC transporter ATP-binding protein/permease [Haloplasma contractile]ERJ12691.1 macrolide transport system ATP-binding-permease protein [Haloplasma contractile SSD-17B]
MLRVKSLNKYYKDAGCNKCHVLRDINLEIKKGEFIAILGESGSGKSTMLNVISGLEPYESGNLTIDGVTTKQFNKNDWAMYRNNNVGIIFQEYHLIDHLSVVENIELPLLLQGTSKRVSRQRALETCKLLGLINHVNKSPNHLSGGQAQRVAIARALITEPKILLADEPTGALDYENSKRILDILKTLSKYHTVILVTHDEEFAHIYADRIITLEDGRITSDSNTCRITSYQSMQKEDLIVRKTGMKHSLLLKFAIHNIHKRKLRTLFTSIIMSIGIVTLFLITFLITGVRNEVTKFVSSSASQNEYTVEPEVKSGIIKKDTVNRIRVMNEVSEAYHGITVQPLTNHKVLQKRINEKESIHIYKADYFRVESIPVLEDNYRKHAFYGRYPTSKNEVLITSKMAEHITGMKNLHESQFKDVLNSMENEPVTVKRITHSKEYDLLKHIQVPPKSEAFKVVGIISSDEFVMYMLHTKTQEYVDRYLDTYNPASGLPRPEIIVDQSHLTVYLNEKDQPEFNKIKNELNTFGLIIKNPYEMMQRTVNQFFDTSLYILLTAASVSLIVSGILIGLIVYISVIERTKEIGILAAIGARASNIRVVFLIESVYIGLFSGIIALVASIIISITINNLFNHTMMAVIQSFKFGLSKELTVLQVDVLSIFIIFMVSAAITALIGYVPAYLASRLNIADALRTE